MRFMDGKQMLHDVLEQLAPDRLESLQLRYLTARETFSLPSVHDDAGLRNVMIRFANRLVSAGLGMPLDSFGDNEFHWQHDEYDFASWYGARATNGDDVHTPRPPQFGGRPSGGGDGLIGEVLRARQHVAPRLSSLDRFPAEASLASLPSRSAIDRLFSNPLPGPGPMPAGMIREAEEFNRFMNGTMPAPDAWQAYLQLSRSARGSSAGLGVFLDRYTTFVMERSVGQQYRKVFQEHRLYDPFVQLTVATALVDEYGSLLFPDGHGAVPALLAPNIGLHVTRLAQRLRGIDRGMTT